MYTECFSVVGSLESEPALTLGEKSQKVLFFFSKFKMENM